MTTPPTKEQVDAAIEYVQSTAPHLGPVSYKHDWVSAGRTLAAEVERLREREKVLFSLSDRLCRYIDWRVMPRSLHDAAKKAGVI